jgi:cytochrome d ubiquinol oxidase subunit II
MTIHPDWLAIIFGGLTALSVLLYAILDGYDLGVGITLPMKNESQRDTSIASIGPFWDANETWLVLAVGLLLVAFPAAHSAILKALYLPATALLVGLILRGVAFDFRAKVAATKKRTWDYVFKIGSCLASFSQGFMLGIYIMGLEYSTTSIVFAVFSGLCVTAAYALIGNAWLVLKTSGELQLRAVKLCKRAGTITLFGIVSVSMINPLVNSNVMAVWSTPPWAYLYALIPLLCFAMFIIGYLVLRALPMKNDAGAWLPFAMSVVIFVTCFFGLALSFYPYVVPNQMTLFEAASAPESLMIIFYGALFVVPIIIGYTCVAYYAFKGKADSLNYY